MYRVWDFVTNYSLLLIVGAVTAMFWANTDPIGYHHFVQHPLWFNDLIGLDYSYWTQSYGEGFERYEVGDITKVLSPHYLVNGVLMALFFAVAAKEVWEAVILKNGALRGKKAATPLFATAGGILGPIVVYLGLASVMGSDTYSALANGWAIPTATDIAFSYLVGRVIFGAGHPAVRFLLLLAIADDAAALVIVAIFYPSGAVEPEWLLLSVAAAVAVFVLANWLPRKLDRGNQMRPASTFMRTKLHFFPYLIAGCISWYGFAESGLNPALGLLPIVPTIPHADRAFGIFSEAEQYLTDLLNQMQNALKHPVEIILFLFGLLNAGMEFSSIGAATWLVLAALLIGKPVGIFLFGWIAARPLGFGIPKGMRIVDLVVIGCVASIGFTVSLFVASVAFDPGPVQDAAKMGALFSFVALVVSVTVAKLCRVQKQHS
ncbi:Na+/H+ antiporter NhaA [Litoreibacter arenae]|uniref:Na(+)/H(+) antiporter NhaA n=1 Tax=Litoreibacter arenae DSM 19593 TaxID=1123360 RepID=S9QC78_9RHOB|nr:Na+/H+ antiporter NhaA [Litoreibacter arenae]EPX77188.1 Na+/H+ antiporter NhaA type [Litoreibacter arenae DSM 19593]